MMQNYNQLSAVKVDKKNMIQFMAVMLTLNSLISVHQSHVFTLTEQ